MSVNQVTESDLNDYQQYLKLRDEDIAEIEQRVLEPRRLQYERQQAVERRRQAQLTQQATEPPG